VYFVQSARVRFTASCTDAPRMKQHDFKMFEAEFVSKDSDQTETAPNREQAPAVRPGKASRASDSVLAAAGMRVTARYSGATDDLRLADEMLAQARAKPLPSTRTEIGAGGELIDREKVGSPLVDTVAHPDYVTAEASSDRLALASQAGSLSLALDAADTIQAQDGLEKMLVHQMAALHYGMMRATARMNKSSCREKSPPLVSRCGLSRGNLLASRVAALKRTRHSWTRARDYSISYNACCNVPSMIQRIMQFPVDLIRLVSELGAKRANEDISKETAGIGGPRDHRCCKHNSYYDAFLHHGLHPLRANTLARVENGLGWRSDQNRYE
jgi:hypothetical protein